MEIGYISVVIFDCRLKQRKEKLLIYYRQFLQEKSMKSFRKMRLQKC